MASLPDMLRCRTTLDEADVAFLRLLVGEWRLLSDLSFSDLLLFVTTDEDRLLVVAAQRPTTGATALVEDFVGRDFERSERPLVDACFADGMRHRQGDPEWSADIPVRVEAIPVRRAGRVVAVVLRTGSLLAVRMPSRLEIAYQDAAGALATMISEGEFPTPTASPDGESPRVGDGFVRIDPVGVVTFASPNAVSAYRGLGLVSDLVGEVLGETTARALARGPRPETTHESVQAALSGRRHRTLEVSVGGFVMSLRVIPLTAAGTHLGAIVLVRDVTEVRRQERQLVSKDATIREIHHRVKNNLQTVAALLRMQARRLDTEEGRSALLEAQRRIATIATVHDLLAGTMGGPVDLDHLVDRLLHSASDVHSPSLSISVVREGSVGMVPAEHAMALAMVVTELIANAAEHAFAEKGTTTDPEILARLNRQPNAIVIEVRDNGVGFSDEPSTGSLGLHIVRSLLVDLHGTLEIDSVSPHGVSATVMVPVDGPGLPVQPPARGAASEPWRAPGHADA